MANPFSKGWKYMMSAFDKKIDDNADPKVQIAQAAEAERQRHQQIQNQAAAVIGNRNQIEMQLGRLQKEREKLTSNVRQALSQVDAKRAAGDESGAQRQEQTAEVFASQLVSVESELENTAQSYEQAKRAAEEAQHQAKQSQARFEQMKSQIRELESQADQAKMQETASSALKSMQGVSDNPNVPTLEDVREKIESRYAHALGAQELAENSHVNRMTEIEAAGKDARADMRLAEIRAQMAGESRDKQLNSAAAGAIEAGEDDSAANGAPADAAEGLADESSSSAENGESKRK